MNLPKSMLGRISTSVVSQISSSLFSPSINQSETKKAWNVCKGNASSLNQHTTEKNKINNIVRKLS